MKKKKKKKEKKKETINKRTLVARSTFGFPFSNKSWTICSCPFWAATQRGVVPSFTLKKNRKMRKWKRKRKRNNINKRTLQLQDQHLVFLFPIKVEQFVHVHFEAATQRRVVPSFHE